MIRGNINQLFRSKDGATAVEFALIAPALLFLTFAIVESGIAFAADIVLKNATYDAARTGRTGFVSEDSTQDATVKQKIRSQAGMIMDIDKLVITSLSYKSFDVLKKPEPFIDKNKNGVRDNGENFTDVNGNGKYDLDQGANGYGGSVNRRRNGTPYRLPKGTPASSCIGSARVGPGLSI